ncbi:hypothetical protein L7F22_029926 [Adiantum nelumboides]|nr:hypothetical protein [Adiantum nelumboides]
MQQLLKVLFRGFLHHNIGLWLEAKDFSLEEKSIGLGKAASKEHGTSELLKLEVALKYASLVAHSIWVSWSVDRLTALLARDLAKDEDLASSSPLKGWEETTLTQFNEKGDEIDVKLPLPAMPSSYVLSFLFKSCQEVYCVGGHALDKIVLHLFVSRLFEKVLLVYDNFISSLKDSRSRASEKGLLQVLFDLRFVGDVLSGGERCYPDHAVVSSAIQSHCSLLVSFSLFVCISICIVYIKLIL